MITKEENFSDPSRRSTASRPTLAYSATSGASPRRSNTASSAINEGIIWIESAPFGGMKESGIGREGSKHGIEEFLEVKYLCMGDIDR